MLFDPLKLLQRLWGLCTNPRILLFAALQLTLATALGLLCALLALPQLWYIWPEWAAVREELLRDSIDCVCMWIGAGVWEAIVHTWQFADDVCRAFEHLCGPWFEREMVIANANLFYLFHVELALEEMPEDFSFRPGIWWEPFKLLCRGLWSLGPFGPFRPLKPKDN